jgi:hypothetical protein
MATYRVSVGNAGDAGRVRAHRCLGVTLDGVTDDLHLDAVDEAVLVISFGSLMRQWRGAPDIEIVQLGKGGDGQVDVRGAGRAA